MPQPEVRTFSTGSFDNNVYVLIDPETRESALIDTPGDAASIMRALEGTTLKYILMTHADPDHISALEEVHETTGVPIAINPAEERRLPHLPDIHIHDGDVFRVGNLEVRAIVTPGHTPGGVSFLVDGILFAGDTLFPGGPGNTERPISSFETIVDSIRNKLFSLPDDTIVYPGHGKPTTIGAERPHLQEWIDRGW